MMKSFDLEFERFLMGQNLLLELFKVETYLEMTFFDDLFEYVPLSSPRFDGTPMTSHSNDEPLLKGLEDYDKKKKIQKEAVTVEENILGSVSRTFDLRNRGVKIRDFLVITEIKRQGVSSCLIENGFLDDEDDMKIIFNQLDDYGKTIALAIAEGFGIA